MLGQALQLGHSAVLLVQKTRPRRAQRCLAAPQLQAGMPVHHLTFRRSVRQHGGHGRSTCSRLVLAALAGSTALQHTRHFLQQLVLLQWLGRKAIHASRIGCAAVLLQHAGRERNDGNTGLLMLGLPGANGHGSLQTIHVRHLQVHQDDVERLCLPQLQGLQTIAGRYHLVAMALHHYLQQLQVLWHIVGSQNVQRRQLHRAGNRFINGRLTNRQGQLHMELRALTFTAADADCAAHQLHQLARDGGAQARTTKAARGGRISLCKRVKNTFELVLRNANARVLDGQVQAALLIVHAQLHMAAFSELDGIAHQIDENLLNTQRIPAQIARPTARRTSISAPFLCSACTSRPAPMMLVCPVLMWRCR